jgi:hypothetical protein
MRPEVVVSYGPGYLSAGLEDPDATAQRSLDWLIDELIEKGILRTAAMKFTPTGNPAFLLGPSLTETHPADLSVSLTQTLRSWMGVGLVRVMVVKGEMDSSTLGVLLCSLGNSEVLCTIVPSLHMASAELRSDDDYDLVVAYATPETPWVMPHRKTPVMQFCQEISSFYRGPLIITSDDDQLVAMIGRVVKHTTCHTFALTAEVAAIVRPLVQAATADPFQG